MYINPAALVAFLSSFIGSATPEPSNIIQAPLPLSGNTDAALAGTAQHGHSHAKGRLNKHRHGNLKKRALTVWNTQTVQYTVPNPKSYEPTSAVAYPSSSSSSQVYFAATTLATSQQAKASATSEASPAQTTSSISSGSANGPKKVFAHFMMGNSYPMGVSDFASDISTASAAGIDGFALNVGPDSWMADRVAKMYEAAEGTSFKLFISLDMAVMASESISSLTPWITDYNSHPNQYFYNDKQFVSTFAGESVTFGQSSAQAGWTSFKSTLSSAGIDIFFMPSFTALGPSAALSMTSNDGAFSWDAWPTTDGEMTTAEDQAYMDDRNGKLYMAGVSPWFFTHFSYKNWIYKSDDLFTTRWEELVSLQPDFIEIITWNDYGESSYIGPMDGATPYDSEINSSSWVTGFDHTAWISLAKYYISAYKNAAYPTVTSNELYWWYRSHPKDASASSDPYGKPTNYDWADDNIYLTVMLTGSATITVTSGGSSQTFNGVAGRNHFQYIGFSAGTPTVSITMNGANVLSTTGPISITNSPTTYNFNPVVASSTF